MTDLPFPRSSNNPRVPRSIVLTSHPAAASGLGAGTATGIVWGAVDPIVRGPVVATMHTPGGRNTIGTHAGAYSLYRALAIAAPTSPTPPPPPRSALSRSGSTRN
jgi:hypothetical protein